MKTSTTNTESPKDSSTTTESDADKVITPADLGYDDPIDDVPAVKPDEVPAPKPVETPAEKVENPATGYGKTDPAAEPAKVEDPAAEPEAGSEEEKEAKAIADAISTLGDGINKEKITKFAKEHKLTKEQVAAYVAQTKADQAEAVKVNEERVKTQRQQWNDELVKDVDFGGENFEKNIFEVEKVVEKLFPNTKKVLTEKKGMLPPYFMKDLLAVAKALNPTNKFEGGEPPAPKEEGSNFLDDMYE